MIMLTKDAVQVEFHVVKIVLLDPTEEPNRS